MPSSARSPLPASTGAEIFENDLLSSHLSAREIAALMAELGLDLHDVPAVPRP
jgi:hypothetical protein